MMIAIILLAFIAVKMYKTFQENKLGESVFMRMAGTLQYGDIKDATSEMSTDSFILVSYVKNENVKNFEEKLKKTVLENELQSNFYYLDATDLMLDDDYVEKLNAQFELTDRNVIEELPAILYYKEGTLMTTISSSHDRMMTSEDFEKLLDSYEINIKK